MNEASRISVPAVATNVTAERTFPIMLSRDRQDRTATLARLRRSGCCFAVVCIPWRMIAPHARRAQRNHDRPLEDLARDGGLTADEVLAVLEDRSWRDMPVAQARGQLHRVIEIWTAGPGRPRRASKGAVADRRAHPWAHLRDPTRTARRWHPC